MEKHATLAANIEREVDRHPTECLQKRNMIAAGVLCVLAPRHKCGGTAHKAQRPIDFYKSWHTATMHRKFASAGMVLKQGKKQNELTNRRKPANDLNF